MSWERRVMAQFEAKVRRAEAKAARGRRRQSSQETADEKDLRLAEEQCRLEEEENKLEQELKKLEKTPILEQANLQRQIEWHESRLEAVKRQRQENRGFATTLEY
ncbi:MAG: hypothetical protein MUP64_10345 [Anaerolineae bacterium]|nr:hypothetical protein [Anaerolineae bacterium]